MMMRKPAALLTSTGVGKRANDEGWRAEVRLVQELGEELKEAKQAQRVQEHGEGMKVAGEEVVAMAVVHG
jgi:hypothetical protein